MSKASNRSWSKGELYHTVCLFGIAVCLWVAGSDLGLFTFLQGMSAKYGLADLVMLGCIMSFAIAIASALKSLELRKSMAAREVAEGQAQALARHDPLTGLANRRLLSEAVREASSAGQAQHALLIIDLDRFKPVNDVHGHPAGDAVLCQTAERIKRLMPGSATVARLGGDEFAILLRSCDQHEMMRLAQQIITSINAPYRLGDTSIEIGATIGIAMMPADGADASSLLRCADIALYRGKKEGRNTFRFFEQCMDEELRARASLEAEIRAAIANGEIKPHYQPLVSLQEQELLGFEVLARWYHPTKGVLSPSVFIDIAEDTGLISDLSYKLLKEACLDAKSWPPHLRLAMNISPYQLRDKYLPERLLGICLETGFAPGRLEIEITESALASDLDTARATLTSLQNSGVKIALDDFGTGYSSLYHLRELRFDKIKIDRSFVQALNRDGESTKIVDAIINLGKSLGLLTTAEGIENTENLEWLARQGCSFGQGYLFGAPMPAVTVGGLLDDNTPGALGGTTPVRAERPAPRDDLYEAAFPIPSAAA